METKFVSNCADEIESFKLREFKEGISPQGRFKSRSVAPIMLSAKTHLMMTPMTPLDKRLALCKAVYLLHWISPVVFIKHCICVHVVWGEAHSSLYQHCSKQGQISVKHTSIKHKRSIIYNRSDSKTTGSVAFSLEWKRVKHFIHSQHRDNNKTISVGGQQIAWCLPEQHEGKESYVHWPIAPVHPGWVPNTLTSYSCCHGWSWIYY